MDKQIQFIPAEPGWLALFEEGNGEETDIHAEPVIAWCLGTGDSATGDHVVAFGQAVIGAGPWIEKAGSERASHFFALVREEQLDDELRAELVRKSRRPREALLEAAKAHREELAQGHTSWVHERRRQRTDKRPPAPTRIL